MSLKMTYVSKRLINAVSVKQPIWDPTHELHKNRRVIHSLWQEIADELQTDRESTKHKWKNLKDYYRNERKKTKRLRSLKETSQYESRWPYYSLMHFLDKTLSSSSKLRKSNTSDLEVTANSVTAEDNSDNEQSDMYNNDNNSVSHRLDQTNIGKISINNLDRQPNACKKRNTDRNELLGKILELEENKFKLLESQKDDTDQDLLFFKSLLPDFKTLSRTKRMHLKLQFQQLLFDEVRLHENTNS